MDIVALAIVLAVSSFVAGWCLATIRERRRRPPVSTRR